MADLTQAPPPPSAEFLRRMNAAPEPTYMVSVDGSNAPSHEHKNLADARAEAIRLSLKHANQLRKVRVLQVIDVLEPQHTHKWRSEHHAHP